MDMDFKTHPVLQQEQYFLLIWKDVGQYLNNASKYINHQNHSQ